MHKWILIVPQKHISFVGISVGGSEVLWQQNHLWPDWREAQRHHLYPGVWNVIQVRVCLPLSLKSSSVAAVCRMKSVWDPEKPVISLSWGNWKTRWATIPTSSGKRRLALEMIVAAPVSRGRCLTPVCRLHLLVSFSHKLANGKTRRVLSREEFRLLHYAGEVNYNVNGKPPPWAERGQKANKWSVKYYFKSLLFLFKNNDQKIIK